MYLQLRPSKREIDKKLGEARDALLKGKVSFANEAKIINELMALNIGDAEDVWPLVLDLIEELELADYDGHYPPQKSYEPMIANCELWAFSWESEMMKMSMYLKFAIKDGCFFYVSLHKSKFTS